MPGIVLSPIHSILITDCKKGIIINSILQMGKRRNRKVKKTYSRSHTVSSRVGI